MMAWPKKKKNLRNQKNQNENQTGIFHRKADWAKVLIEKASLSNTGLPCV